MESDGVRRQMSSESFHIIAVDPGLICGVTVVTVSPSDITRSTSELPWLKAVEYVERWLHEDNVSLCSERYDIPTGRSVVSAQQEAIKTNGALEYLSSLRKITFVLQPRAEVKKVVSDVLLRKLSWYVKTKDGHSNDSTRHAGFWLLQHHPVVWLRLTDGL